MKIKTNLTKEIKNLTINLQELHPELNPKDHKELIETVFYATIAKTLVLEDQMKSLSEKKALKTKLKIEKQLKKFILKKRPELK